MHVKSKRYTRLQTPPGQPFTAGTFETLVQSTSSYIYLNKKEPKLEGMGDPATCITFDRKLV